MILCTSTIRLPQRPSKAHTHIPISQGQNRVSKTIIIRQKDRAGKHKNGSTLYGFSRNSNRDGLQPCTLRTACWGGAFRKILSTSHLAGGEHEACRSHKVIHRAIAKQGSDAGLRADSSLVCRPATPQTEAWPSELHSIAHVMPNCSNREKGGSLREGQQNQRELPCFRDGEDLNAHGKVGRLWPNQYKPASPFFFLKGFPKPV